MEPNGTGFLQQRSYAAEFDLVDAADFGGDEVAKAVGGVIAAEAFLVGIGFEDVGRAIGVVLEVTV